MNIFTRPPKFKAATSRVRLVTPDAALEERLSREFSNDRRFDLVGVRRSAVEAATLADLRANCAVLVVDINPANTREFAALETITGSVGGGAPVIVISDDLGGETARLLLQLQVADWLPRQASHSDFHQACERALRNKEANGRTRASKCLAFYPALGGVGNTTLSESAAFILAGGKRERRSACLVDLDLQSGTLAEYLDLPPNLQLDNLAGTPDRLDGHLLEMLLSRHASGIAVLAAPNSLTGFDAASPQLIARILDLAATKFDNIIVDLPRIWLPWSEGVLRGADHFFVVTDLSVPGLRQAGRIVDELQRRFDVPTKGRIIVNKVRWLGAHGVKKKDAREVLGDRLAGFVSEESALVNDSHNRGVPLSELKRSNRLERDLATILLAVGK